MAADVTDDPEGPQRVAGQTLAAWSCLLIAIINLTPYIAVLIMLPGTGPVETRTLMAPIFDDIHMTHTLSIAGLLGVAGYDRVARHQIRRGDYEPPTR